MFLLDGWNIIPACQPDRGLSHAIRIQLEEGSALSSTRFLGSVLDTGAAMSRVGCRQARAQGQLMKLQKHKSLDLTRLQASAYSIAQMREKEGAEVQRWMVQRWNSSRRLSVSQKTQMVLEWHGFETRSLFTKGSSAKQNLEKYDMIHLFEGNTRAKVVPTCCLR
jgi:hypothetical protein